MGTDKLRINSGVKVPVGRAVLVIAPAVEQGIARVAVGGELQAEETVRVAAEPVIAPVAAELGIAPAVAALAIALVVVEPEIGPAVAALAIAPVEVERAIAPVEAELELAQAVGEPELVPVAVALKRTRSVIAALHRVLVRVIAAEE
jgi:hypothetical protein